MQEVSKQSRGLSPQMVNQSIDTLGRYQIESSIGICGSIQERSSSLPRGALPIQLISPNPCQNEPNLSLRACRVLPAPLPKTPMSEIKSSPLEKLWSPSIPIHHFHPPPQTFPLPTKANSRLRNCDPFYLAFPPASIGAIAAVRDAKNLCRIHRHCRSARCKNLCRIPLSFPRRGV